MRFGPLPHVALVGSAFIFAVSTMISGRRDRHDSIRSLSEPTLSTAYQSGFWARTAEEDAALWEEALKTCAKVKTEPALRPNCAIVAAVADPARWQHFGEESLPRIAEGNKGGQTSARDEIGSGLTGHGAHAGDLPTLKP